MLRLKYRHTMYVSSQHDWLSLLTKASREAWSQVISLVESQRFVPRLLAPLPPVTSLVIGPIMTPRTRNPQPSLTGPPNNSVSSSLNIVALLVTVITEGALGTK